MSSSKKLDFYFINDQLLNWGSVHSASELHGLLCGLLCALGSLERAEWLERAEKFMDLSLVGGLDSESETVLSQFLIDSCAALDDQNYVFQMLLPGDSSSLARRITELASWCKSFLLGVAASGIKGDKQLSPELAEILRDLAEISQADTDVDDDADEAEAFEVQFTELHEYVKTAVLTFKANIVSDDAESDTERQIQSGSDGPRSGTIH